MIRDTIDNRDSYCVSTFFQVKNPQKINYLTNGVLYAIDFWSWYFGF